MKKEKENFLKPLILAGGKGIRLGNLTKNVPKPLLKINEKYFIEFILEKIIYLGFNEVFISISYLSEVFFQILGHKYKNLEIKYFCEKEPLGTGGAIKNVFENSNVKYLIIFNGDSYCDFDLKLLIQEFTLKKKNMVLTCKIENTGRFGNISFNGEKKIINFFEKKIISSGYVNAGIYVLDKRITKIKKKKFSIEKDFLERCDIYDIYAFLISAKFIDIGTQESFKHSKKFFKKL